MQTGTLTDVCARYLGEYLGKIRFCVERLPAEKLWWRAASGSNSVGNLLLHLAGNLSQWVLSGLGGEPYERHRDAEFAAEEGPPGHELLRRLGSVVERSQDILRRLTDEDLRRGHAIQGYDTDGLGVVLHITEHMAYHTGQVVFVMKQLLGPVEKIEFYPQHRGE